MISEAQNFPELARFYYAEVIQRGSGLFGRARRSAASTAASSAPVDRRLHGDARSSRPLVMRSIVAALVPGLRRSGGLRRPEAYFAHTVDLLLDGLRPAEPCAPLTPTRTPGASPCSPPVQSSVALVAVLALAACSKQAAPPPAPRTVIAQVVGAEPGDGANVYSGEVRARYENDLAFRVGGKIVARYVDVGASVKKGQPLARLDPQDAQLGATAARSALAAARGRSRAGEGGARALPRPVREEVRQPGGARSPRDDVQHRPRRGSSRRARSSATASNQSSYTTLARRGRRGDHRGRASRRDRWSPPGRR